MVSRGVGMDGEGMVWQDGDAVWGGGMVLLGGGVWYGVMG